MKPRALVLSAALLAGPMAFVACGEVESAASGGETQPESVAGLEFMRLHSPSIYCYGCVGTIQARLDELGLARITGDPDKKVMTGYYDPERLEPEEIRRAVERLGYRVDRVETGEDARRASP